MMQLASEMLSTGCVRLAGSINAFRNIGLLGVLVLALGTSLAMAQQGQAIPKTKGPKPAPVAAPAAAGAGVGQVDESSWAKLCTKNEQTGNKQVCLVQHWGLDPETGIVLGTTDVRSVEGEDKQTLLVTLTTNYSLALPVGVHIEIDGSEPISLRYIVCFGTSCQAESELTKDNLDKMRKGKQMVVSAITMQEQKMSFPVTLTGFGTAYDGPPTDMAKYQEASRQLLEKSHQRQIELADKNAAQQKEQGMQQPQAGAPPQAGVLPGQPSGH
jgi:invasion protein IalB